MPMSRSSIAECKKNCPYCLTGSHLITKLNIPLQCNENVTQQHKIPKTICQNDQYGASQYGTDLHEQITR